MTDLALAFISFLCITLIALILLLRLYLNLKLKAKHLEQLERLYKNSLYYLPFELILLKGEEIIFFNKRALENLGGYPRLADLKRLTQRKGKKFELLEVSFSEAYRLLLFLDVTERESFKEAYQMALSYLSHELKTPLAIAVGYLERLGEALKKERVNEETLALYQKTQEAFQRLEKLLKKLFSGIEYLAKDIKISKERLNLKELIEEALFWVSPLAEEKGIIFDFQIEEGITLLGSPELLIHALFNILENAVKASPPKEKIEIRAFSTAENQVELYIRDYGPGVEPEKLPLLGMPFFKLRDNEGMGLGLFITKRIVEAHGGGLNFSLPPGRGLEVSISMPKEGSPTS